MGRRDLTSESWQRELARQRERRVHRDRAKHAAEERARYQAKRATGWRRQQARSYTPHPPRRPADPVPEWEMHPLYEGFRFSRDEAGFDDGFRDDAQEWALAVLEGRDPAAAVTALRKERWLDQRVLVRGLVMVDDLRR